MVLLPGIYVKVIALIELSAVYSLLTVALQNALEFCSLFENQVTVGRQPYKQPECRYYCTTTEADSM
jgi:hypothetical protein